MNVSELEIYIKRKASGILNANDQVVGREFLWKRIRASIKTPFVARSSEKPVIKAAGAKRPEACLNDRVRTFCSENADHGLRSSAYGGQQIGVLI